MNFTTTRYFKLYTNCIEIQQKQFVKLSTLFFENKHFTCSATLRPQYELKFSLRQRLYVVPFETVIKFLLKKGCSLTFSVPVNCIQTGYQWLYNQSIGIILSVKAMTAPQDIQIN